MKIDFEECSLKIEFKESSLKVEERSLQIEFEEMRAFFRLVEALKSEIFIWK